MRTSASLYLLLALSLASAHVASSESSSPDTSTVECTFSNPAYSGLCGVTETVPQGTRVSTACKRILACLNDPQCTTKTYCNATTVRGGWKLVKGQRQKPSPFREQNTNPQ